MSASLLLFVSSLLWSAQQVPDLTPPKLIRAVPGNGGVYVGIEKRAEDVERDLRYCVYISMQPGGPYVLRDRFWAKLYKGIAEHTNGYIGHLPNEAPCHFVVSVEDGGKESAYSNEVSATPMANGKVAVPYIEGKWWRLCESAPDVAPCNNPPKHNACDFTIWKGGGGKWYCAACIRGTTYPSQTRLL